MAPNPIRICPSIAVPLLQRILPVLFVWGCGSGLATTAEAAQVDVAEELERLASVHGFEVRGEEHVQDAIGRAEGDTPYQQVRLLLENFDHIILQGPQGEIERVIVLGMAMPGQAPPKTVIHVDEPTDEEQAEAEPIPGQIELPTVRNGNQHSVRVSLETSNGKRVERALLIDTGADTLVLPGSMIAALGIAESGLRKRRVQTANGQVQARIGKLPGLWLGDQKVADVEVAFLEDDKLGSSGLLGMNVLSRYQMTIDDEHDKLTLIRR
jgi:aspartyl protease family protein